jgi:hypothetical protein
MRYEDAMSQDGHSICLVSAIQMSINGSRWAIGCFDGAPALDRRREADVPDDQPQPE